MINESLLDASYIGRFTEGDNRTIGRSFLATGTSDVSGRSASNAC